MPRPQPQDLPMCPQCSVRLRAGGTSQHPYLQCPGCGHVALPKEPKAERRGSVAQLVARVLNRSAEASGRSLAGR